MEKNQAQQKPAHDARACLREFGTGQSIMACNLRHGDPWIPAIIVMKLGLVAYMVRTRKKVPITGRARSFLLF